MEKIESPALEINKEPTNRSSKSVVREFCDYTSIHGLGRTAGAKYLVQRIVWFLLFLVALGMAVFQLRELYLKYESRPVSTLMKLTNKANLRFPEVTFCNINPLNAALVKKKRPGLYRDIISPQKNNGDFDEEPISWPIFSEEENAVDNKTSPDKTTPETPNPHLNTSIGSFKDKGSDNREEDEDEDDLDDEQLPRRKRRRRRRRSPIEGDEEGELGDGGDSDDNADDDDGNTDDEDYDYDYDDDDDDDDDDFSVNPSELLASHRRQQRMYQFVSEIEDELGYQMGNQFHDSVLACSFRGMDCKNKMIDYWEKFWHHKYGTCYTFNAQHKKLKPLKSNKAGPSHGLTLTLFVDQANYMSQFTRKAGFKIVINEPGLMTFPYEEGINVPPGVFASIGMRKVLIKRVDPFKNNSCFDHKRRSNKNNLYHLYYGSKYSNNACRESCLAYNQRKYCNCSEYRFPFIDKTPACLLFNITHATCLRKVNAMFKGNKLNCSKECTPPCKEDYYKLTPSYAAWPSKKYEEEIYKGKDEDLDKKIHFSDNYLKVSIFFEQLNYEIIEEMVSYGLIDFISDVGGQLGLWLGVSVLAATEVIELMILLIFFLCKKEKKPERGMDGNENIPLQDEMKLPTISSL